MRFQVASVDVTVAPHLPWTGLGRGVQFVFLSVSLPLLSWPRHSTASSGD